MGWTLKWSFRDQGFEFRGIIIERQGPGVAHRLRLSSEGRFMRFSAFVVREAAFSLLTCDGKHTKHAQSESAGPKKSCRHKKKDTLAAMPTSTVDTKNL